MHFITGGTGFIGAYVARDLLRRGEGVVLFDRDPDRTLLDLLLGDAADGRVTLEKGDAASAADLSAAVARHRPEVIVHLASPLPPRTEEDVSTSAADITGAQINVFEAARSFGVRRVVWASATSVFGPPAPHGGPDAVVADDAPHYPTSLYGIFKSANERLARHYHDKYGIESVGLRFAQGYGPGKSRGRPFGYRLFEDLLDGRAGTLPYGDDVINWQFIDDIAAIVVRAIDRPAVGCVAANTAGEVLAARETAHLLEDLVPGARIDLEDGTAGIVWRYRTDFVTDVLGFGPPTPAREGFARTLETMRAWRRRTT